MTVRGRSPEAVHPRKPRRSPSPASPATQNHPTAARVNPDASLYCSAPDNDALARHGRAALGGWSGSAVRRRLACGAALAARSRRRSRLGRGHSSCRSTPGRDNPHKETASPAARHDVRIRYRHVDERRDCQDNVLACVPSTVWGTASRRNSQVGLGAVLALKSAYATNLHAPRQPGLARQSPRPANCFRRHDASFKPPFSHPRCSRRDSRKRRHVRANKGEFRQPLTVLDYEDTGDLSLDVHGDEH